MLHSLPGIETSSRQGPRQPGARWQRLLALGLLVAGGAVTVAVAGFILSHLNDRTVLRVGLPGFILGIGLLVASTLLQFQLAGAGRAARGAARLARRR